MSLETQPFRRAKRERNFLSYAFCPNFTKQSITEYDEQLTRRLIEKITVYEDHYTIEFKSGTSMDVHR